MPATEHVEKHFTATAAVRDIVIGMSDGLTVPFALAAGLTGAVASTAIVVTAGLAEIAAGSIAMGLGGYLAAKTDTEHYASELDREYRETVELPEIETEEVAKVFRDYGLSATQMAPIVATITADQKKWVDFMMRFELGLEQPDPARAEAQRRNDRCFVRRGRIDTAGALHADSSRYTHGADLVGGGDVAGAFYFWRDQGTLHRRETVARWDANDLGGWAGRGGGVFDRTID